VRVIEVAVEPGIVVSAPAPVGLERRVFLAHEHECVGFRMALGSLVPGARKCGSEALALPLHEIREVPLPLEARAIDCERLQLVAALEPSLDCVVLDGRGERFAEIGIALGIQALMRELMKQCGRDVRLAAGEHGVQHGIRKVSERRVRG
jgi:hypothetical protein